MTPTIPRNSFWIDHGKFCFTQFIICCAMLIPIRLQDLHFFPRFPPGAFRSHAAFRRYGPYPWHWPWGSLAAHPSSPQTIPLLKYFEFGLKKESFKWIWGCIQMDLVYRPRNQTKKKWLQNNPHAATHHPSTRWPSRKRQGPEEDEWEKTSTKPCSWLQVHT